MILDKMRKTIYPQRRRPYYIVTPPYVRTSAGVRALHLICHWLNACGEAAFVYIWPNTVSEATNPDLLTPVVDERVVTHHQLAGLDPIVIYSDTAQSNFIQADIVVRYIGHLPGHLSDFKKFNEIELFYSHSTAIAQKTENPDNTLFVPGCNPSIFYPAEVGTIRSGTCFYAAKYKHVHNGTVFDIPSGCFEITRDEPSQLSQHELADLFRKSETLYCFEDSAIANEAAMCGCPVVLMPSDHFKYPIAIDEVGWDGYAWGNNPEAVERARGTVFHAFDNYLRLIEKFHKDLYVFILKTQEFAKPLKQTRKIVSPAVAEARLHPTRLRTDRLRKMAENLPLVGRSIRSGNRLRLRIRHMEDRLDAILDKFHAVSLRARAEGLDLSDIDSQHRRGDRLNVTQPRNLG